MGFHGKEREGCEERGVGGFCVELGKVKDLGTVSQVVFLGESWKRVPFTGSLCLRASDEIGILPKP